MHRFHPGRHAAALLIAAPLLTDAARPQGISLISVTPANQAAVSGGGRCSDDGRWVVFDSHSPNLVPGDTNNATDVFLRDRVAGTTIRIPKK